MCFFFFVVNFFFKTSLLLAIYSDLILQMTGFDIHSWTHLDSGGGIWGMTASICSPPRPSPFLTCTVPFLNYRRFHHVHMQGCVGGWRGCHHTGKTLWIWKNFAFIWGLLFVSLSSLKCPCVQALPLLNSYYYLALEGHANCLITWRVMKQLGHQHIIQVWAPKGK